MSRRLFLAAALAVSVFAVPAQGRASGLQSDRSPTTLEVLVLDHDGEPLSGLTERDFVVTRNGANYAVTDVEERVAGEAPRRFVFVFNRRGADASQLSRALRGLRHSSRKACWIPTNRCSRISARPCGSAGRSVREEGWRSRDSRPSPPWGTGAPPGPRMTPRSPRGCWNWSPSGSRSAPGRKIVVMFSRSLSSFSWSGEQPGTIRKPNHSRIRSDPRGQLDAGLAPITQRFSAAQATVHVLHLAGVRELEERILTANRGELIVGEFGIHGNTLSSTTRDGRQQAVSPRGADDILSSFAAESGGLYFARATGFRLPLDRIAARNERWYRLSLGGEDEAAERQSGVPQVLVPGCGDCTVLPATNPE